MASSSATKMWEPSQWQTASDFYGSMMTPGTPSAWTTAEQQATKMAGSDYYNNLWGAQSQNLMNDWSNQAKQLAEQYTPGGVGSSALGRNIGQVGSQMYQSLYPQFLSQMLGGQQNAVNSLYNLGAGRVSMGQNAASGMAGIGSLQAQLPLQVSAAMGNAATNQTQNQMSPYLSLLSSLLGQSTSPTMYNQSQLTGALGSLGSVPGSTWSNLLGGSQYGTGTGNGIFDWSW